MKPRIRCNNCFWEGEERDLEVNQETLEDACPSCHYEGGLMTLDGTEEFTTEELRAMDKDYRDNKHDQTL